MPTSTADIRLPSESREMIRAGTLVVLNHSGGKDSQAMTILLSRIVPRDRMIAVHAPLGAVQWPGTIEHIEATLPEGVPLILAPVSSGKTLLDSIEERGHFPSPSIRWCLAPTSPISRTPGAASAPVPDWRTSEFTTFVIRMRRGRWPWARASQ